ncbi:MAG: CopG family transcriptional regulator [Bacillota bacterium]|nr:CopG family transcriptional regulator [Bacillota bacterium]
MIKEGKRTTIYLDPHLHKALKLKAIETSSSMSELINNAVKESIVEDVEDNETFEERVNEELVSYDAMIRKLKSDGRL